VDKAAQNAPSISSEIMTGLAALKKNRERILFILCAATGMRISEALGLEIGKHITDEFSTLHIEQKANGCKAEKRLKTRNAYREIDLHSSLVELLRTFIGNRKEGFLFCSRQGKPLSQSNILRRHLHPALKQLGYVNPFTGLHKAGNHVFRRFRNTYLRNHTNCPEGVLKFWLGHAPETMSDLYDKIRHDVAFRKDVAERVGVGFQLPASIAPNAPKRHEEAEVVSSM
jgi:integrase